MLARSDLTDPATIGAVSEQRPPLYRFWSPRYWGQWLGIGLLRAAVWLPMPVQLAIGRFLGRLLYWSMPNRRWYARRNLEVCFPNNSSAATESLLKRHFEALGMSLMEMGVAWFGNIEKVRRYTRVFGAEHLQAALDSGHGVVLFTGHFTTLEFAGPTLAELCPTLLAVYRPHRNPFIDEIFRRGRERSAKQTIPKDDIRAMVRGLRQGGVMWYAPDQSFRRKLGGLVPFFGEPAMTNLATSQLVRMGKAKLIPFFPRRADDNTYVLSFAPPLERFPGDDAEQDTIRLMRLLEDHISECPEQYYWVHRRFKGRPVPLPDIYQRA